jgi:hypothetical protein
MSTCVAARSATSTFHASGRCRPLQLSLLQRAQQLGCSSSGSSPISSRNSVPPFAISNRPAVARRAGERALLVAEQLALDQALGMRAQLIGTNGWSARRLQACSVPRGVPCRFRPRQGSARRVVEPRPGARAAASSTHARSCGFQDPRRTAPPALARAAWRARGPAGAAAPSFGRARRCGSRRKHLARTPRRELHGALRVRLAHGAVERQHAQRLLAA